MSFFPNGSETLILEFRKWKIKVNLTCTTASIGIGGGEADRSRLLSLLWLFFLYIDFVSSLSTENLALILFESGSFISNISLKLSFLVSSFILKTAFDESLDIETVDADLLGK